MLVHCGHSSRPVGMSTDNERRVSEQISGRAARSRVYRRWECVAGFIFSSWQSELLKYILTGAGNVCRVTFSVAGRTGNVCRVTFSVADRAGREGGVS